MWKCGVTIEDKKKEWRKDIKKLFGLEECKNGL